ncbi:response regulator transcription factor [Chryseobacterium lacus]|uniref:DNA-binding response regulator n=1 Tax=Chryseobacterium lacus TaxID=2058346 RepID=A0A368N077_9FLAO|nr:response regulator transcription factor [Chryseobacterium lacus]ODS87473.1 MAG: hypothetical protein ABS44_10920 [Chryseobacterium sp. SCN 40-13]RCU43044.1 DNA-binding response regulator [Chryseobacterium lacus]RST27894.1 response regulator transcription factor [Chryseobacterium lacus]
MKKIVLIEDEEILRKSLAHFLTSKSYLVLEFDNGLDAISYIEKEYPSIDLVITDLFLPFKGGHQVVQACKEIEGAQMPVMVLTASGVEETELDLLNMGADDFITKPFSPSVLLKRIEKLMA